MARRSFMPCSISCSRAGPAGCAVSMASAAGLPVGRPSRPLVDMIETSESARSGCWAATIWAIMPPIEAPTICALSMPSASSSPTASSAMSLSRYGASTALPLTTRPIASGMLGRPQAPKSVDRPMSRLSKRMTKKPCRASPSNNASGQMVSCAPNPMISSRAGSLRLPAVSYSISIPLALTRAMRAPPAWGQYRPSLAAHQ